MAIVPAIAIEEVLVDTLKKDLEMTEIEKTIRNSVLEQAARTIESQADIFCKIGSRAEPISPETLRIVNISYEVAAEVRNLKSGAHHDPTS